MWGEKRFLCVGRTGHPRPAGDTERGARRPRVTGIPCKTISAAGRHLKRPACGQPQEERDLQAWGLGDGDAGSALPAQALLSWEPTARWVAVSDSPPILPPGHLPGGRWPHAPAARCWPPPRPGPASTRAGAGARLRPSSGPLSRDAARAPGPGSEKGRGRAQDSRPRLRLPGGPPALSPCEGPTEAGEGASRSQNARPTVHPVGCFGFRPDGVKCL